MTPSYVFLDTSIFDRENYNFRSKKFRAFLEAIRDEHLTLVIPDPTHREIVAHIRERVREANKLWLELGKNHFFTDEPHEDRMDLLATNMLFRLESFKRKFESVIFLDNASVSAAEMLDWYHDGKAPFGPGKKKSEFPDAFATRALVEFAERRGAVVIVSQDGDFEGVCNRYPHLFQFFSSLEAFTATLIKEQAEAKSILDWISRNDGQVKDALQEAFLGLDFVLEQPDGNATDPKVESLEINSLNVIGVSSVSIIVAFVVFVSFTVEGSMRPPHQRGLISGRLDGRVVEEGVIYLAGEGNDLELGGVVYDDGPVFVEAEPGDFIR